MQNINIIFLELRDIKNIWETTMIRQDVYNNVLQWAGLALPRPFS
jgi:hypothetical protein